MFFRIKSLFSRYVLFHIVHFDFGTWYYTFVVIDVEINKKLIGIRIMQRRKSLGLTQEDLAEKVGLSKNHLSNIECGKYLPTTQFIIQICNILGETPDYYLIGKLSEESSKFESLLAGLPAESQRIICRLLETYVAEISSNP